MSKKLNWNILIKEDNKTIDSFTVKSENNLTALLKAQEVFLSNHKDYECVDCGMWIDEDTVQRDLYVETNTILGTTERYFSIEIDK